MVNFSSLQDNVREFGKHEWLVTNGIGGYAAGTVSGILSRHYHGLLIAALEPPLGRTLTVVKLNEYATYQDKEYGLSLDETESGMVDDDHLKTLKHFHLDMGMPVWTYQFANIELEKRIWMEQGENTTYVQYTLVQATKPLSLSLEVMVNYRDHHASTIIKDDRTWRMQLNPIKDGLQVIAQDGATPFYVLAEGGLATPHHVWVKGYYKSTEAYRGEPTRDDHLLAGTLEVILQRGQSVTFVCSTNPRAELNGSEALKRQRDYAQSLFDIAKVSGALAEFRQLVLAADQFIVRRATPEHPDGMSILAGFPWFSDWGRDTMIALPGLTLTTGRHEVAAKILRTFARYVDQGMLPNRFPDEGETPEYNTVDATLWYFEAIRAYYAATSDKRLLQELMPVLKDIIHWHLKGTRYSIKVDPTDALLYAGEADVQLTWMDVKIDDWVVTPRTGKAVEVNALWYNALRVMQDFAAICGEDPAPYDTAANRVQESFNKFWNGSYCDDVIGGADGNDSRFRPNQVIAAALHYSPLDAEKQKAIVDLCAEKLLSPVGLRSLAPDDPAYIGHYGGDRRTRDAAYHQGTVWGWLIGSFVAAHLCVYNDKAQARKFLEPFISHLSAHGLGTISEIFDGDAPHSPRGCFAQAWSVAEVLRVWALLDG